MKTVDEVWEEYRCATDALIRFEKKHVGNHYPVHRFVIYDAIGNMPDLYLLHAQLSVAVHLTLNRYWQLVLNRN